MNDKKRALIISCFDIWYCNRIEPIIEVLKENDYTVKILVSDFHHIKKEYVDKKYSRCTYIHVQSYKKNLSVKRIISHLTFGYKTKKYLNAYKPNLIYLLLPPNNMAVYCNKYKKEHPDCLYIVDILDLWPESLPLSILKHSPPAIAWRKMRDVSIRSADHVFTECKLYQRRLNRVLDPSKTSTLYLYKKQSEEEQRMVKSILEEKDRCKRDRIDRELKFAYLGSINSIIDIDGICGFLKSLNDKGVSASVEIIGDGESRETFLADLRMTGTVVNYHGAIYDEMEKIRILAQCDFALNMMKDTSQVGLTIKSIDYISYGLPLINSIKGDTWRIVEKYGIGINIDNRSSGNIERIDGRIVIMVFERFFTDKVFTRNFKDIFEGIDKL